MCAWEICRRLLQASPSIQTSFISTMHILSILYSNTHTVHTQTLQLWHFICSVLCVGASAISLSIYLCLIPRQFHTLPLPKVRIYDLLSTVTSSESRHCVCYHVQHTQSLESAGKKAWRQCCPQTLSSSCSSSAKSAALPLQELLIHTHLLLSLLNKYDLYTNAVLVVVHFTFHNFSL